MLSNYISLLAPSIFNLMLCLMPCCKKLTLISSFYIHAYICLCACARAPISVFLLAGGRVPGLCVCDVNRFYLFNVGLTTMLSLTLIISSICENSQDCSSLLLKQKLFYHYHQMSYIKSELKWITCSLPCSIVVAAQQDSLKP